MKSAGVICLSKWLINILTIALLTSCSMQSSPILFPKGPVTETERELLFLAVLIMLSVLVPVYLLTFWACWRYRASKNNCYRPQWHKDWRVELFIWAGPVIIIGIIGYLVVVYTYRLDPYRSLDNRANIFRVQVVAQNWKWLFIYPDQGVSVVNELAFPSHRPLSLEITSDTVLTSFMIPALGGQIYAMAGMKTRLNLESYKPGHFIGRNTQFSGRGFPKMAFDVYAMSPADFSQWLEKVKGAKKVLDVQQYQQLISSEKGHPVEYFSAVEPELFNRIIAKYTGKGRPLPLLKPDNLE